MCQHSLHLAALRGRTKFSALSHRCTTAFSPPPATSSRNSVTCRWTSCGCELASLSSRAIRDCDGVALKPADGDEKSEKLRLFVPLGERRKGSEAGKAGRV